MADQPLTEVICAALDAGQGGLPVHPDVTALAEALLQAERLTADGRTG